jgi:DNA replication protein DnaC
MSAMHSRPGHTVCFLTLENLMGRLVRARHENRLDRILQQLANPCVLILDELGYLLLGRLPAPTGVCVTATTEDEQD